EGERGLFVKEIERELERGRIDLAVHSLKDMPAALPPGMAVAAVTRRADPFDAIVSAGGEELLDLPGGGRVGTSSPRRAALILAVRPDLRIVPAKGNLDTRLRRLDEGVFDAVVVAAAGLARLGLTGVLTQRLTPPSFLPAPGQGCLAVEARSDDAAAARIAGAIDHPPSRAAAAAERALLAALGGGCRTPIAAYAEPAASRGTLRLAGCILSPDGRRAARGDAEGPAADPAALGRRLAEQLLRAGGAALRNG
ncbi:MAG: hydroxymethylbilane synthase, partial [bacterium]|nr:hydroxymethylbilane synthase [bacterium]